MQPRFTSLVLTGALGALILSATPTISRADPVPVRERMHRQLDRIEEGVDQGQINKAEGRRLIKEQARTRQAQYRMRHNDGHLGPRERARLHHRLNKTSRHIYHARHN